MNQKEFFKAELICENLRIILYCCSEKESLRMTSCRKIIIEEDLIQFSEEGYVDSYLILGSKEAVLVDTLENAEDLYDKVTETTDLPLKVLLTHAHPDHAGKGIWKFAEHDIPVYLDSRDDFLLASFGLQDLPYIPLTDGMAFDLGNTVIESIHCYGHTPGSVVFLDRAKQRLFSGDSVGSGGFWLQLSHSLSMTEFRKELVRLLDLTKDMEDLKLYPGHRSQAPVTLDKGYLVDELALIDDILAGRMTYPKEIMTVEDEPLTYCKASRGYLADFCYNPDKLI